MSQSQLKQEVVLAVRAGGRQELLRKRLSLHLYHLQGRKQKEGHRGTQEAFPVRCAAPEVIFRSGVSKHFITARCKWRAAMKLIEKKNNYGNLWVRLTFLK